MIVYVKGFKRLFLPEDDRKWLNGCQGHVEEGRGCLFVKVKISSQRWLYPCCQSSEKLEYPGDKGSKILHCFGLSRFFYFYYFSFTISFNVSVQLSYILQAFIALFWKAWYRLHLLVVVVVLSPLMNDLIFFFSGVHVGSFMIPCCLDLTK